MKKKSENGYYPHLEAISSNNIKKKKVKLLIDLMSIKTLLFW